MRKLRAGAQPGERVPHGRPHPAAQGLLEQRRELGVDCLDASEDAVLDTGHEQVGRGLDRVEDPRDQVPHDSAIPDGRVVHASKGRGGHESPRVTHLRQSAPCRRITRRRTDADIACPMAGNAPICALRFYWIDRLFVAAGEARPA